MSVAESSLIGTVERCMGDVAVIGTYALRRHAQSCTHVLPVFRFHLLILSASTHFDQYY